MERMARECGMSPRTFLRRFHDATGSTPGDFEIVLEQNETGGVSDTDYVTVLSITQANFKTVEFRNVTISERFVRLRVVDATTNAGTVSLDILSA